MERKEAMNGMPTCGAKTKRGGVCKLPAGSGTPHQGRGRCRFHLGCTASHLKKNAKEEALALGGLVELSTEEALTFLVHRAAGLVDHAEGQLRDKPDDETIRDLHSASLDRLLRFAKTAADAGIDERRLQASETMGDLMAALLETVFEALGTAPQDRARVLPIVQTRLLQMETAA